MAGSSAMRAVVLHPHPDMGGNRRNPVVTALAAALGGAHTFDFSSSDPDVARAETVDALGDGPVWLAGYSFGGGIATLVDDPRVLGWVLVAPALALVAPVVGADPRPKLVLACARDTYFPPGALTEATAGWAATEHGVVDGADHFLRGHEADVAARCRAWVLQFAP